MEWIDAARAAYFQQGPRSLWIRQGTLRTVSEISYRRNLYCLSLLAKCVLDFYESLVHPILHPDSSNLDAVVVSIDLEGLDVHQTIRCPTSIGVATLDTRALFDASIPSSCKIHTKFYHRSSFPKAQSSRSRPSCNGNRRTKGRYLFSEREQFYKSTTLEVLKRVLMHEGRNVILLSHSIESDLNFLAYMGFKPEEHANITSILDTGLIAAEMSKRGECAGVFGPGKGLGQMLNDLGFAGKEFHNAANDANFTLRGLLLLLARALRDHQEDVRIATLLEIALEPLPTRPSRPRPQRLEHLRPEAVRANLMKKQARKAAEWDEDLSAALAELEI